MCEAVEESPEETDNMHFPIVRGDTKLTTSPAELSDDGLTEHSSRQRTMQWLSLKWQEWTEWS